MATGLKNWAGNLSYGTASIHHPENVEQIQHIVRHSQQVRVLGSRHSFNQITESTGDLIVLDAYPPEVNIDPERKQATISGGMTYSQLCPILDHAGFALRNLASLPHISVVGACSTATHGSGDHNPNLAASIAGLEIVTANGDLLHLARGDAVFEAAPVGLGALGVVVRVTLDLLPAFDVRQDIFHGLPMAQVEAHFDDIMSSAYSVSMFTNWQGDTINQVWLKQHVDDDAAGAGDEFFGASRVNRRTHPIEALSADTVTEQRGIPGSSYERLPHFRIDSPPKPGNELQSEYFVPRDNAVDALRAVASVAPQLEPYLMISEIRTVAADALWMSTCYQQDSVALHFTWKPDWPAVRPALPILEAQLEPFGARPHWGKLFSIPPQRVQAFYEKLPQFKQLLLQYDPEGKFRNAFIDTTLFGNENS